MIQFQYDEMPLCHPFVKWAGGKRQLLPILYTFTPTEFDMYFEPFLGGGAMFFYLISDKKLLFTPHISDINPELINCYIVIKENIEELIKSLERQEIEYKKAPREYYYQLRSNKSSDNIERASRFIILIRTCYNGIYRLNKNGEFNVPWGKYEGLVYDTNNLRNVSFVLRHSNATIKACDYREMVENAKEGDFIYLDPPYAPVSNTAHFTNYTNSGFGYKDQEEPSYIFRKLADRKCKVLLTNSNTDFIKRLYAGYNIIEVDSVRAINCKGSSRAGYKDVIIRNYR